MANKKSPCAVIKMKSGGIIKIELFPEKAPLTVASFVDLCNNGFYNNLQFHRVVEGFMIQGGSANNSCASTPCGFRVKGEFKDNGVDTGLKHTRGTVSMARSRHPDSAGTQFFIVHQDSTFLDGQYGAFAAVVDGFDELDRIAKVAVGPDHQQNPPLDPEVIESITIEMGDYTLPADLGRLSE